MCGIAGFIDDTLLPEERKSLTIKMLESIAFRGPDARGLHIHESTALGHNRLSIIDLSHEADQPMISDELAIVFNGEIYNYLEIKSQLVQRGYKFSTSSDTEVILNSYREWKDKCVDRFVGMWSFVILDKSKQQLFISRDRFGIKPLYYIHYDEKFYFASEYKPLKLSPCFSNDLNLNQVARGLQMGWLCYNDETYYERIRTLPAAHNMLVEVKNGKVARLSFTKYWTIDSASKSALSPKQKSEAFRKLFEESINLHMRSDVPVATCLSGGLDSSAIVSTIQSLNPGINYKSFSIYYDGENDVDERPFINEVIAKYPSIDPYYKKPVDAEVRQEFHRALFHADVPATGSSFISQYFLMKLISENEIKVVLDGQGSDEYLAGYMHSHYRNISGLIRSLKLPGAISATLDLKSRLSMNWLKTLSHFSKSLLTAVNSEQELYNLEFKHYYPYLLRDRLKKPPFDLQEMAGSRLDQFLYHLITNTSLPSLLHYEDRNSMAFSIESRVPFLDHRLVEFGFNLQDEDRIKNNETKYILRQALQGVLPEAIKNRQDKKGFVTPGENKWLRGPLSNLLEIDYNNLDFLDVIKVKSLVDEYKSGDNSKATVVWRLATLNYWLKNFN